MQAAFSVKMASDVYQDLANLKSFYPDFENWYWTKVVPGLQDQSRALFVHEHQGQLSVVIAKRTFDERKLCTVRTAPNLAGMGIGTKLMTEAIAWLGCDKPLMTVPEERLTEFKPLLNRLQFTLQESVNSYYRPNCREHVFNGRITSHGRFRAPLRQSGSDRLRSQRNKGYRVLERVL